MRRKKLMKLIKVKLINWHIFSNHTINLNGNTLITGENASGKSTLMDAIYFVLTGGDYTQFNKAANVNDKSQRTIESYTRGKIGSERNPFLRNDNDIISYIILELVEESINEHFVLGVEIETQSFNSRPKTKFFTIKKYEINDEDFIKNNSPISFRILKADFKARRNDLSELPDTLIERKRLIGRDIFKLVDYKRFFDLLKNAISFHPISEVSSFVNGFLLKEDDINLDSLKEEIRSYQEIEKLLTREKEKIQFLDDFIPKAEKYKANAEEIKFLNVLKINFDIEKSKREIENKNYQLKKLDDAYTNIIAKQNDLNAKILSLRREIEQLENDEDYKALLEKKNKLQEYINNLTRTNEELNQFNLLISKEQKLIKNLNLSYKLTTDTYNKDYPLLRSHLEKYKAEIESLDESLRDEKSFITTSLNNHKIEKSKKEEELKGLKQGINNYPDDVNNLLNLAKDAIRNYNPKETNPNVRPFCEYIEILDKTWTNALEGYLNTQRFNIIIEPKYYDVVSKAYQEYKNDHKVYIAGIVNVEKIKESEHIPNSMMDNIKVSNPNAYKYASYLLGNLICVNDVLDLKKYKSSITKDVMIYKNCVLKACDPNIYNKPYIGADSIKKRIEILQQEIKELNIKIEQENIDINNIKEKLYLMSKSKVKDILNYRNLWIEIDNLNENINSLKEEIEHDEKSSGLFGISERINLAKANINKANRELSIKNKEYDENRIEFGKLQGEIQSLNDTISTLSFDFEEAKKAIKDDDLYRQKYREYCSNNKLDIVKINQEYVRASRSNAINQSYLLTVMRDYSAKFKGSLTALIENIDDFINEYYYIKNRDVVKYEEEAHDAYIRAEASFKEDFISKLKEKIERSQKTLDKINKNLALHPFGNDEEIYKFHYEGTKDPEFNNYYRIIMSGKLMESQDLFTETLDEKDNSFMKDLFDKITREKTSSEDEITLRKYLDYRNYMNYDIKITNKYGDESYFSKISKEKSGGETQTPFYIVIASCFDELMNKDQKVKSTCVVVFDEAFNNMDEGRIKSLMEFYKGLNIQLIIIVPSNRISSITKYMDSVVGLVKKNNYPIIFNMKKSQEAEAK